jgi:hypothetical protein
LLVFVSRDLSFWYDEWEFVLRRPVSIESLVKPWGGGQPQVLPVLIWQAITAVFGTSSYWPFLVAAWIAHASVVAAVYAMTRSPWVGLVMLVLGSGGQNIVWAFQIGMMLATALGLWAIWIAPRRPALAGVLLVGGVLSHGVGVAFAAACAVRLALERRRAVAWIALPAAGWLAWRIVAGAQSSLSMAGLPVFVLDGMKHAIAGVLGSFGSLNRWKWDPSLSALGAALVVGALLLSRRRPSTLLVSLFAASIAVYATAGLVKSDPFPTRYVYSAAPGLLIVGAVLLRPLPRIAGAALLAVALLGNVMLLWQQAEIRMERQMCERQQVPESARPLEMLLRPYPC